ncbi:PAP2 superfamily protein [Bradyrhizobium sp. Rc2d]|uniref:phosphatase PAP2 family protein n=1 Tax=Bradyrhizobium sp. Rc2d TaxID=1855321 RepID=UPI0008835087|nr:phosphatase PAP2 family protein [Bradyrhizobium sp. Rc2d]SDH99918.1 PAP2 superfamily protein [Bradyrhizobium sp. Rc2d]
MTVRAYVRNSPAQSAGAQTSSEAVEACGLYLLNWITITILALFVGVSLALLKLSMALEGELLGGIATVAGLTAAGHVLLSRVRAVRIAYVLISIAQLGLVSMLGAVLTYVAASANLPLQDAMLDSWDKFFGLDWTVYYRLMTAWPALLPYACLSYGAIGLPPIAVPIVLGLTNNHVRLQQFTMATLLTLCAVALISALIPAIGTYQQYNLPTEFATFKASGYLIQLDRLPVVRSSSLQVLNISQIGGIVTFPSFHAAAALLALWAWWGVWWMRPWALMMCVAMLAATPLWGGHYFVDIFAGVAVAALAIAFAKAIEGQSLVIPHGAKSTSLACVTP